MVSVVTVSAKNLHVGASDEKQTRDPQSASNRQIMQNNATDAILQQ